MKDFLPGGHTIGKKQIYSFTLHTTFAQPRRDALSNTEYLRTLLFIHICEIRCVPARNNQGMTRIDRLNVHYRHAKVVLMNDGHFQFAGYEFAKYAVRFIHIEVTGKPKRSSTRRSFASYSSFGARLNPLRSQHAVVETDRKRKCLSLTL